MNELEDCVLKTDKETFAKLAYLITFHAKDLWLRPDGSVHNDSVSVLWNESEVAIMLPGYMVKS